MAISDQNFDFYRGDSMLVLIDIDLSALSIESLGAFWQMAGSVNLACPLLLSKTLDDGLTITPDGLELELTSTDTNQRAGRGYYHDLRIIDGDDVYTAMAGGIWVKPALPVLTSGIRPNRRIIRLQAKVPTVAS
jgi:hypothetical protein